MLEYLALVKQSPPHSRGRTSVPCLRGHMFKCLFTAMAIRTDLRARLTKARTVEEMVRASLHVRVCVYLRICLSVRTRVLCVVVWPPSPHLTRSLAPSDHTGNNIEVVISDKKVSTKEANFRLTSGFLSKPLHTLTSRRFTLGTRAMSPSWGRRKTRRASSRHL